jgi:hypothetical protein
VSNAPGRLDVGEVRAALRAADVLARFGIEARRAGDQLRTHHCPTCGQRSRDAVVIDAETGVWTDHAHGCAGDVLALLAGYASIDIARDFRRVLELAAELAGTHAPPSFTSPARAARPDFTEQWTALSRWHERGAEYLAGRGLYPLELRAQDVVRYSAAGDPAVALRDLRTGAVVGIQERRSAGPHTVKGGAVKDAALIGRATELGRDGVDTAVICEGLVDSLTAVLAWPACAVFGAPGAGQLRSIARVVAPAVAAIAGWLFIAIDFDEPGIANGAQAIAAAVDAGMVVDRDLHVVDLGRHHDLNDAWRAGWRPTWPR